MAAFISLNPKIKPAMPGDSAQEQVCNLQRMLAVWMMAAIYQQGGRIHFKGENFRRAMKTFDACGEMPVFKVEQYDDGCTSIELADENAASSSA